MKFKVGDRVLINRAYRGVVKKEDTGFIHSIDPDGNYWVMRDGTGIRTFHHRREHPELEPLIETGKEPVPAHSHVVSTGLLLPVNSEERKNILLMGGLWDYFPAALIAVARISKKGNDKHNPGQPLHHSRSKSNDHRECIMRHLLDWDQLDEDGEYHIDHLIWRACALSQIMKENNGAPKARGAR